MQDHDPLGGNVKNYAADGVLRKDNPKSRLAATVEGPDFPTCLQDLPFDAHFVGAFSFGDRLQLGHVGIRTVTKPHGTGIVGKHDLDLVIPVVPARLRLVAVRIEHGGVNSTPDSTELVCRRQLGRSRSPNRQTRFCLPKIPRASTRNSGIRRLEEARQHSQADEHHQGREIHTTHRWQDLADGREHGLGESM